MHLTLDQSAALSGERRHINDNRSGSGLSRPRAELGGRAVVIFGGQCRLVVRIIRDLASREIEDLVHCQHKAKGLEFRLEPVRCSLNSNLQIKLLTQHKGLNHSPRSVRASTFWVASAGGFSSGRSSASASADAGTWSPVCGLLRYFVPWLTLLTLTSAAG